MKRPDELDENEVLKRWREAIQSAPSIISSIFKNGRIRAMSWRELHKKLGEMRLGDDMDDVIYEAEREKLITIDYSTWSAYLWIPPEKRDEEVKKTERLKKMVEDAFLERDVNVLSRDKLKKILANKGLSEIDIKQAIYEAKRDCVISSFTEKRAEMCELIPPEEREARREMRRLAMFYATKRLYERAEMGLEI